MYEDQAAYKVKYVENINEEQFGEKWNRIMDTKIQTAELVI